jgi:hypothetical protein
MFKYSRECVNCGCVASWGNTHEGFYCEDCYAAKVTAELSEPKVCVCCGQPATQTVNCEPNCDRCATKLLAPETLLRKCSGCKRMHTDCNDIDGQILCPDCADEWVAICRDRDVPESALSICEACHKVRECDFNGERCSILS